MIMIFDNGPYHHGTDNWESSRKATKAANATLMPDLGVNTISVQCDGAPQNFAVPGEAARSGLQEVQWETFLLAKELRPSRPTVPTSQICGVFGIMPSLHRLRQV